MLVQTLPVGVFYFRIIAIGITNEIDEKQLTEHVVSRPPLKHFFKVDQFEELAIILDRYARC